MTSNTWGFGLRVGRASGPAGKGEGPVAPDLPQRDGVLSLYERHRGKDSREGKRSCPGGVSLDPRTALPVASAGPTGSGLSGRRHMPPTLGLPTPSMPSPTVRRPQYPRGESPNSAGSHRPGSSHRTGSEARRTFGQVLLPVLALFLMVGSLGVQSAEAQQIRSPYQFIDTRHSAGIFVGIAQENRGQLDLAPGGGIMVGARYGIELSGPFALEGTAFFLPTDRNVFDPTVDPDEQLPELLGTSNSLVAGIDGRLRFTLTGARTWHGLAPFVLMGGGVAGDLTPRSSLEDELVSEERFTLGPSFLGVLGAGTRWLPTENLTFRVDALLHLWKAGTPRAFFQFEEQYGSVPEQEWPSVGALVLGGSYRF